MAFSKNRGKSHARKCGCWQLSQLEYKERCQRYGYWTDRIIFPHWISIEAQFKATLEVALLRCLSLIQREIPKELWYSIYFLSLWYYRKHNDLLFSTVREWPIQVWIQPHALYIEEKNACKICGGDLSFSKNHMISYLSYINLTYHWT